MTSITHARALLDCIEAAGGTAPAKLTNLLGVVDQLAAAPADADPLAGLVDALADGQVTAKQLDATLAKAAAAENAKVFRDRLRQQSSGLVVKRFRAALEDGAADEILDSLRPIVAKNAAALAGAAALISEFETPDQLIRGGSPEAIQAWSTGLDGPTDALRRVAAVVVEILGPEGSWSLIDYPTHLFGVDFISYTGAGIFMTGDTVPLATASALLKRTGVHRDSPFVNLATQLTMNSLAYARERARAYAEACWAGMHGSAHEGRGTFDPDGGFIPDQPRPNPYARATTA